MNTFSNSLTLPRRPTSDEARRAALRAAVARAAKAVWGSLGMARLPSARPAGRDPVREAGELRDLARSLASTDPRFAADLMAAADRHEVQHGV